MTAGYSLFESQVAQVAKGAGIDAQAKDDFYSWLRESRPQALQRAVQELTLTRRLDGFRQLATEYRTKGR